VAEKSRFWARFPWGFMPESAEQLAQVFCRRTRELSVMAVRSASEATSTFPERSVRLPQGGGRDKVNRDPPTRPVLSPTLSPARNEIGNNLNEGASFMTTPTSGKVILIVDDDHELNNGLRVVLEKQGHRVLQAANGIQAKEMIYRQRPDLVILDMMMPRMGGYPVLEHFKDKTDAPPIIMMTANEGSRHKAYAEFLGVIDYIRKPFSMDKLLESVEKGLAPKAEAEPPPEAEPKKTRGRAQQDD
jgi:CheY-like chemotaxis protein